MRDTPQPVHLFIPCLVDQVYPEMGLAMVRVLERLGWQVLYNPAQTCCGQPAFNAGHTAEAASVARVWLKAFDNASGVVVCPSGSCTAMVRNFYPQLFGTDPAVEALRGRVLEFSEFLTHYGPPERIRGRWRGRVGFHNSCHSYRELHIHQDWQKILQHIQGLELTQPAGEPVCCGFGGTFSVKFAAISSTMAHTRLEMFLEAGAETVVSNDPGCIMHMRQEAAARRLPVRILHLAEFLQACLDGTNDGN